MHAQNTRPDKHESWMNVREQTLDRFSTDTFANAEQKLHTGLEV